MQDEQRPRGSFAGRKVLVMGLGHFGGSVGVARWLAEQGARVLVTDMQPAEKLQDGIAALKTYVDDGRISLRLGEHRMEDFTQSEVVVASPAVPKPWGNVYLRAAREAGVDVTTEIALLVERLPSRERTIAITGSAGKSTTTAMIHHALRAVHGDVVVGGNLGGSLLPALGDIGGSTIVVLELSSAQLWWLSQTRAFSPRVGVLTSFAANHLDWHGSLEEYRACKALLFAHMREGDTAVLDRGLDAAWAACVPAGVRVVWSQEAEFGATPMIPGRHNRANAAMALRACVAAIGGGREEELRGAIAAFPGLSHRLEVVGVVRGVRCINDSKSTTPEATLTAVDAVCEDGGEARARVHLIAGGYDKGSDLTPIAKLGASLAGLYVIGATGAAIARAAGPECIVCGTLERAVAMVFERARAGDVVLLSPGCASWDQFANFEARGDLFRSLVQKMGA